ncbi:MAG: YegS/Rv2252/BmrU family lipid kinase [Eggerthellaceae bacterium]|nr:YegS/Rv2252/BmrU family lipid kinase [Eggerthellaceae bacterium]
MHDTKTLIIANPVAKRGEGARAAYHVRRLLREALGTGAVDEVQTASAGQATFLAAGAVGAYGTVVVVGGDGVIHEVANGLMSLEPGERPALGVVPVGSGNDYARTLGMSENVEEAVAQLLVSKPRLLDVGQVNEEYFVETLSFGLDAAIALGTVERRKTTQKTGRSLYFDVGIDQLLHHLVSYRVQGAFDGQRALDVMAMTFAVQIGPTYGGGFRICPDALPDDGLFDICFAEAPWSVPRAVLVFSRAKKGKHVHARGINFDRASELVLRFDEQLPAQADGEKVEGTDFVITMHERALPVLLP